MASKNEERTAPVESLMRVPPVEASPSDKVSKTAEMMISHNVGAVIVTTNGKPVGIVTERDIIERVVKASRDPNKTVAGDIMSSPTAIIEHNKSVTDALKLMREKRIRRLAVTRDGRLVGMLTERRLLSLVPIDRILVPIDRSRTSSKTLQVALDLARRYSSTVTILNVLNRPPFMDGLADRLRKELKKNEENSKQLLEEALARARETGVEASTRLEYGQPADRIIRIVEREDFGLIIIGAKGDRTTKNFLLGNVADKVSHHAACPVFIVR